MRSIRAPRSTQRHRCRRHQRHLPPRPDRTVPLPDATIDVSISNCVINLSTDKPAVFSEMHRVLRNGGRIGISDVVVDNDLDPDVVAEQAARIGCVAGALIFDAYQQQLANAGFANMTVTSTHELGEGLHSARTRATKA